jgi:hypothetical protein
MQSMKNLIIATSLVILFIVRPAEAQQSVLDVDMIMQDYRTWVGAWPSDAHWTDRGDFYYFSWNPGGAFPADSLFRVPRGGGEPVQVGPDERRTLPPRFSGWQHGTHSYDRDFRRRAFTRDGDVYLYDIRRDELARLTNTRGGIGNVRFSADNRALIFIMGGNLYRMETGSPALRQITDIRSGSERTERKPSDQRQFLIDQQLELFDYIREQKELREHREAARDQERDVRRHEEPYTHDNKDRWIARLDPEAGTVTALDRQRDEAWIAGPGISWWGGRATSAGCPDNRPSGSRARPPATATSTRWTSPRARSPSSPGAFEVESPRLSKGGRWWTFQSSEGSPYEWHSTGCRSAAARATGSPRGRPQRRGALAG